MIRLPDRAASDRLVLRRWQHDEAALLGAAVAASLEHLRPWMPWVKLEPLVLAERITLIEGWTRQWENGGEAVYGVFLDGEVIGCCGLHRRGGPDELEIGYWIAHDHTRQGHATEVTRILTDVAFTVDGIDRVVVVTDEANTASGGVPAKLGFTRERLDIREPAAPAETGRMIIWSVSAGAWNQVGP